MTPQRLQQIRELYEAALAQEAGRRAAYVENHAQGDAELCLEVRRLLDAKDRTGGFLEPLPAPGSSQAETAVAARHVFVAGCVLADRFEVLGLLGQGGMGEVYRAHDRTLQRTVAVKVLRAEQLADSDRRRRFLQEARAASALVHPHIATVYDLASAGQVDFITMEYVAGSTLDRCILSGGLPLEKALEYAVQIADALACAHRAGIVHRDLKPNNVMVTESGVKVLDFGLAKLTEPPAAARDESGPMTHPAGRGDELRTRLTQTIEGNIVGTVGYMSPEQAGGRPVDARSDIFSFGSVLFEMLTGRRAFSGDSQISVLLAILRDDPPPVRRLAPGVPAPVERVVAGCLSKDPARRFQEIAEVRDLLAGIREDSATNLRASRLWARQRRHVWIGAALAVFATMLAAWVWLRAPSRAPMPAPAAIPVTTYPGEEYDPALSPDGKQVAFVWDGPGRDNHDIYVKLLHAGAPLRLTTHPAREVCPAWSPDGQYLAFYRDTPDGREVRVVPALGGPDRLVGISRGLSEIWSLAWTPDGKALIIIDRVDSDAPAQPLAPTVLFVDSGQKRALSRPAAGQSPGDARFALSPDGRKLAFLRVRGGLFGRDIYLLDLDPRWQPRGEPRLLAATDKWISGLDWAADGRSVIFASDRGGNQRLWRVSAARFSSSPALEPLAAVGENATTLSVARRGGALLYTRFSYDINLYRLGPGRNAAPVRVAASTREERMGVFSPDGARMAFVSDRAGSREVWVSNADGAGPMQVTAFHSGNVMSPAWSPDGGSLVFSVLLRGNSDLYIVPSQGGTPRPLATEPSDEILPYWSRDGRSVYFVSNRTRQRQIWKMPSAGGPARQITRHGGGQMTESFDGKLLYYTPSMEPGIWSVPVEGGEERRVLAAGMTYDWTLARHGFYVMQPKATPPRITFYPFGGEPALFAVLPKEFNPRDLALSPDGATLLLSNAEQLESDIMLVEDLR